MTWTFERGTTHWVCNPSGTPVIAYLPDGTTYSLDEGCGVNVTNFGGVLQLDKPGFSQVPPIRSGLSRSHTA